ncbi:response regulator [Rhizobium leguminosarum]|uniref:response regulator n=1 Tax=Rhizobium leguminosarum TaxID=384 RepID=UPI0028F41EF4|nr:response regulator [Rhizobium leguminosarum]
MTNPHATVLVVDDEVRSIEAMQRVLSDEFEVIGARNAKEAEEVLEGEMVQVILCDQRMPGESGVEFLKRVRELWPDTIRIIISGYTDSSDIIEGVNNTGIYQYITKPWSPDKLIDCVRESANLWRLQHEVTDMRIEVKPASEALKKVISDRRRRQSQSFGFDRIVHRGNSALVGPITLAPSRRMNQSLTPRSCLRSVKFTVPRQHVTVDRVAEHFRGVVFGRVVRYEIASLGALNFVLSDTLAGGVVSSLAVDVHGKSLGSAILSLEIPEPSRTAGEDR